VLVQPASIDRWHRDGFRRCWRRRSRRPGRPSIDSPCRDLIQRLARENRLWGAPRIHGELLKLGIAVSERTVSRYLRGRLTAPSQTWRTFLVNHFGPFAFISPVASSHAVSDEHVGDAAGLSFRPAPFSRDGALISNQWAVVDWRRVAPTHVSSLAYRPRSPSRPCAKAKQRRPRPTAVCAIAPGFACVTG
jgi:Homeodomain-like domain